MTRPEVDGQRLTRELDALAAISDAPPPAVTRVVFTEADRRARAYVKGLCEEASFLVREDAVGNTFARWIGAEPELAPVGTGSHIDAIPNAGRYDGTVGVLGALEAMRALARTGYPAAPVHRSARSSLLRSPHGSASDVSAAASSRACSTNRPANA